jgi:hypothetical protein
MNIIETKQDAIKLLQKGEDGHSILYWLDKLPALIDFDADSTVLGSVSEDTENEIEDDLDDLTDEIEDQPQDDLDDYFSLEDEI